ncbi:DUF3772 domain-containing protein [Herbaspirillum sp. RTI4]|uniref:DUF3772 domain-containing protein n=1 Tax=Herbaspirillum sp. RTI4 TaxID=3048640 RepID=UPI002AB453E1|nr:DUF3772 domain-containing protein [Herbaspirillum sp. RTI4]MDY7577387.1 DUF3772 domain-containing protein [Herbaspirillum sp. RTI4]MEA9982385.1 DUF3772 domain-containing protein [Herbaspirillum sp. RTI4]
MTLFFSRKCGAFFCALLMLIGLHAPLWAAEDTTAPLNADAALSDLSKQVNTIQTRLQAKPEDAELLQLRTTALEVVTQADKLGSNLGPNLESVQARLTELGAAKPGVKEPPGIAAQRAQLDKRSLALDAQVKLAGLLSVEAGQAADQISTQRRMQFQAQLGQRTASILSGPFWSELREDWPEDSAHLAALGSELSSAARSTPLLVWAGVLLALVAAMALRSWIRRRLFHLAVNRVPSGRLRRSMLAMSRVLLSAATPALLVWLVWVGLRWGSPLSDGTRSFLSGVLAALCFGGYVSGLGRALLSPNQPSWRLPPLPDEVALTLRRFPLVLALVMASTWIAEQLAVQINAGLATTVALNCMVALLLGVTLGVGLLRGERRWRLLRQATPVDGAAPVIGSPLWLKLVAGISMAVLALGVIALLAGYVAFGGFLVKQLAWGVVVLTSAYLYIGLLDDVCAAWMNASQPEQDASAAVVANHGMRAQTAVLLSGLGRVVLVLLALLLLLAPFGAGPSELFQLLDSAHDGLAIGEIQLRPGALLQSLLVLSLTLLGLRAFKRWLGEHYLPTTGLDAGMRTSVVTLVGYSGGIVVVSLTLSALGIGLERIAWVASALSVGIGFGLQAVVQNFVSGLILLAERPVKVGDWVSLGGIEGDIRRINVRATEIQMADRSTVIVPNSEFITKTVRNVTHTNPLGLVQIKLPLPMDTDVAKVRELLLAAFVDNGEVLDEPAPSVYLDAVDVTGLTLNATGFVSSPRKSYGVRSALLFTVLGSLREEGISLVKPSTLVLREAMAPAITAVAPPEAAVAAKQPL